MKEEVYDGCKLDIREVEDSIEEMAQNKALSYDLIMDKALKLNTENL